MRFVIYGFLFCSTAVLLVLFQNCTTAGQLRVKDPVSAMDAGDVKLRLEAAAKTCADFRAQVVTKRLPTGVKLEGTANFVAKADQVDSIAGSGNLVLIGETPNAKVTSLGAFQGNVYLCGISVERVLESFRGNLISVGGQVTSMESPIANLTLLGAENTELPRDFRGSVVSGTTLATGRGLTYSGQ
ncbi:MAG: hypothetical protein KF767_06455 [Bdellovibrionaceae bacterium]|nr:hypothetical protein [Pseudobdellovibrionaceae bacterium]